MKRLSIALAIIGLLLGTLLVGWYGFGSIWTAMLSVGVWGFAGFCAWQFLTMVVLGVAWRAVAPLDGGRYVLPFVWGRMVRDSAGACLPFSTLGGFVFGVRAATVFGVSWSVAALSIVVDLTAEFLAELAFAMAGLLVLLGRSADRSLITPIVVGLILISLLSVAVVWLRKEATPVFVRFGRRLLGSWFDSQGKGEAIPDRDLAELYGHTGRMALGTAIHLLGWFCKGVGNWIAFRLMGSHIDLVGALAIEALLHVLLVPASIVPGYAGIQEVGYAGIGALFGIPPELSLGVSLLRRARDIALGIPILLLWQAVEVRRLRNPESKSA